MCPSVGPWGRGSLGPSVSLLLFSLLGATYVYGLVVEVVVVVAVIVVIAVIVVVRLLLWTLQVKKWAFDPETRF